MKRSLGRVKNPVGRVDMLALKCAERLAAKHEVAKVIIEEFRPQIETALAVLVGPRNREIREFQKYLRSGLKIMAAQQRRVA